MSEAALPEIYAGMAELWCSPCDTDAETTSRSAQAALGALAPLDAEAAAALARFLARPLAEEVYTELFELDPKCPLYLGSHAFDEPQTCANAGVSDRNAYMGELLGIYRHFGLQPNGRELPDYLPLVLESLASAASQDDAVRTKLISEYVLPYLGPIRARLDELDAPHVHLLDALERVLRLDLALGSQLATEVRHA